LANRNGAVELSARNRIARALAALASMASIPVYGSENVLIAALAKKNVTHTIKSGGAAGAMSARDDGPVETRVAMENGLRDCLTKW
jgi:hypothetical protein